MEQLKEEILLYQNLQQQHVTGEEFIPTITTLLQIFINEFYLTNKVSSCFFYNDNNKFQKEKYDTWVQYFVYKTIFFCKMNHNFNFDSFDLIVMMMEFDTDQKIAKQMLNLEYTNKTEELQWSEMFEEWILNTLDIKNCYYINNFEKKHEIINKLKLFIESKDFFATLPVLEATMKCFKCKSDKIYYDTKQTRSSDEGSTFFYTCLNCNAKW